MFCPCSTYTIFLVDPGSSKAIGSHRSRIMDHGPCFGMNEHLRRATDLILRLPDTTTQKLSFFIGFRSHISSKYALYTKILVIYKMLSTNLFVSKFHFVLGIILGGLGIQNQLLEIKNSKCYIFLQKKELTQNRLCI